MKDTKNMKYIRRDLKSNQWINGKYAKNYQHKMNTITFLKSNYKYKRRCTKCNSSSVQQQKLPVPEENNRITNKISLFNTKFSKILRIFILIMQQATPNINNNNENLLLKQLVVRRKQRTKKQMKKNDDAISYIATDRDNDDINNNNHQVYKDANEDTDTGNDSDNDNVDISNISDEISHQQNNYDKVSTITSTPLRCQKQKHHQIKATKSSSSSLPFLPSSSTSPSPSPSITTSVVQANYEICQWSAILCHYLHDNLLNPHNHHHHQTLHKQSAVLSNWCDNNTGCTSTTSSAARTASICQSVDQYVSATWNSSYTLSGLLLTLFIAFTIGVRSTTAGACWQTVLDNGKCNEMFSLNISKSECCGANQEFAYTDREPTNVEYFFATAIGGGMECSPCLESCKNVKCGPNKKCVKRKGRPKCICAPECGAARRKRKHREHLMQQHHTFHMDASDANRRDDRGDATVSTSNAFKIKLDKSQQSRESRSLSSEITNINLGLEMDKDVANRRIMSLVDRHHHREHNHNQRKLIHIHMRQQQKAKKPLTHPQQQPNHKNQEQKENQKLLITANVEHTEKPTTRRLQIFSNVRTTYARRQKSNKNNDYHEDTDPSDYDEEEEDDYGNDQDEEESSKSIATNNNNNHNDDATRFLNQSLSRHQLKMNTKPNNNRNKKKKKNNHDLATTKIQQHSNNNNNTRVRHPQHNGRHAENTLHHRHQHNHQQQQKQQQQHHHHQQHRHDRHKHNKQQHKQQKNNMDYNTNMTTIVVANTGTATASHNTLHNSSDIDAAASATANAVSKTTLKKHTILKLSLPSSVTTTTTVTTTTSRDTKTLSSSTTPVNSSMSAAGGGGVAAASDSYRSQHLLNHGSKIATSSSSSSSSAILSATTAKSDFAFETTMSAKGEGVLQRRHHDHKEVTMESNNTNNDNRISTLNSYSGKKQQQQQQLPQTQEEQHYDIPLFDGVVDQFALHGFLNKQHTIKNADNLRPTNPVCGTDGRTYNTECQLRKRACRTDNTNLQVAYRGHCKTTCNGVKCTNGLTCVEDQYSMPHCIVCKIQCPQDDYDNDVVDATRAVCGADGNTYKNTCDINRMICKIGRSIGVAYPGPCREDQITCDDINCGPKQVCLIDLLTHKPRCTTCRYKCSRKRRPSQLRFEEGKICGVNNRTYNSWCEMRKDSCSTGFHISIKYSGDCH